MPITSSGLGESAAPALSATADVFNKRAPRVTLANFETGEEISAQFNPQQVKEGLAANFVELDVIGMSHRPLQYKNTENFAFTLDLGFDALSIGGGVGTIMDARAFLMSLMVPPEGAQDVAGGGPPRVAVVWPNLYGLICRITKLDFDLRRFNSTGAPVLFTATLALKETREGRLTSEVVRIRGTEAR